jgi:nucleotidyltransferase substrate binding protein (TIGR01987 family)
MASSNVKQKLEEYAQTIELIERVLSDKELIDAKPIIARAAAIQFFELATESCWKTVKTHLLDFEGIDVASPKKVMREALVVGLLNEEETEIAILMMTDRNLTTHLYNEEQIEVIYQKIPKYLYLMKALAKRIAKASDDK